MSNMHTYNYKCNTCHSTMDMQFNNVIEKDPICSCGFQMDLISYVRSQDTINLFETQVDFE